MQAVEAVTSAVTAEVANSQPAAKQPAKQSTPKQSYDDKLGAEILKAEADLDSSDKDRERKGRVYGKKCSEWRKKNKNQGSRKGFGFEAFCKKHGINYRKARYWADVVDGKIKPYYERGGSSVKATTKEKKAPKPKGFVLTGLNDSQHEEINRSVKNPQLFSLFVYQTAVNPGDQQVRDFVKMCLGNLYLDAQASFLTKIRDWIDGQIEDLKNPVESKIPPRQQLAFSEGEIPVVSNAPDVAAAAVAGA